jgi:hypothetical protein
MSGSSAQLGVAAGDVEHRDRRRRQRVGEHADDARAHRVGELVEPEVVVGARHFLEEQLRLGDAEIVGPERAHADDAEVVVAHHHRVGGAPLVAGEQAGVDVVDVRLERRVEAVTPRLEPGEDGDVVGRQRVLAGTEGVPELPEVHELHPLRLADDQLRAVLDRLVVVRKAERERVARVIGPLDDLDQLALEEVHDAHSQLLTTND